MRIKYLKDKVKKHTKTSSISKRKPKPKPKPKPKQNYKSKNKNAIYTAIIGDYETLNEPKIITPWWDYICFTDNKDMKSDVWQIKHVEKDPNLSDRKNARKIKLLYHKFVGEYENTIYVLGRNKINPRYSNLDHVLSTLRPEYDMVVSRHPRRRCLYDEADTMIKMVRVLGEHTVELIKKQIEHYKKEKMPTGQGLCGCPMLIRRRKNNVAKFCELWWEEVKEYSSRDQISFPYVLWKCPINVRRLPWRYFINVFIDT